jgi:hypothetical protein
VQYNTKVKKGGCNAFVVKRRKTLVEALDASKLSRETAQRITQFSKSDVLKNSVAYFSGH